MPAYRGNGAFTLVLLASCQVKVAANARSDMAFGGHKTYVSIT